eukprot:GHVU01113308.1.p1 GENE.GHVU01113308.1~~GHVU01113308.1.p1  ORF type:complete len:112 (-),score=10.31 GHVU01113308.1:495-830(-)
MSVVDHYSSTVQHPEQPYQPYRTLVAVKQSSGLEVIWKIGSGAEGRTTTTTTAATATDCERQDDGRDARTTCPAAEVESGHISRLRKARNRGTDSTIAGIELYRRALLGSQ